MLISFFIFIGISEHDWLDETQDALKHVLDKIEKRTVPKELLDRLLIIIQHVLEQDLMKARDAYTLMGIFILDVRHKQTLNRKFNCNYPVTPLEDNDAENFCMVTCAITSRFEHLFPSKNQIKNCSACTSNYCVYNHNIV
jgi:hypothetical protein